MWSLFPSTMIVLFGRFCNPCTGFFCGFARRCPTLRIACICFFRSCACRCSPRRIAGTRFFGGCARRCPTRLIRCTCFLAILLPLSHLPCELGIQSLRPLQNCFQRNVVRNEKVTNIFRLDYVRPIGGTEYLPFPDFRCCNFFKDSI